MTDSNRQLYPRNIWTKKVLIPFWVLELVFAFIIFVSSCISLTHASGSDWDSGFTNRHSFQRKYQ